MTPHKLQTFKQYTIDFRLKEFREADREKGIFRSIPFDSEEGQKLLEEYEGGDYQ